MTQRSLATSKGRGLPYSQVFTREAIIPDPFPFIDLLTCPGPPLIPAYRRHVFPRNSPKGGDTVCGYFVPECVAIGYCAKATHHSSAHIGPHPRNYRLEWWLDTSEKKVREMERKKELIFGYGRYQW
jgi:hypothetical protein